ncbi:MAG: M20/M25/M40 family metallo-hydrolase [Candidatus Poribacteria bacterium]|jgi:acetylornithine deacetylase/succinyl-diaminopimelate desuccinylase-like protein|nr:M20 family peptidase [Candidatus Poribacteria bacterium]HIM10208.1 M20 family peptidase [Candidatus Poribacteria bacterium]
MINLISPQLVEKIRRNVNHQRLLDTATALIEVPSPTCSAGAVADQLASLLQDDGFEVERPVANWPEAPAVVVRFATDQPGRVLQFDGHLDTVHLPFVPPRHEHGNLYGSGASDMKGGIAAFVEALRVLRDTHALVAGGVLLTAHDHHEGPWGDRRQLYALIKAGYIGNAVLLPEYLADRLPIAGRGMAIFETHISRDGQPIHEVLRPPQQPDVLATGAELILRLRDLQQSLESRTHPHAGTDSVFVGHIQAGEIYNQSPTECVLQGTRRWVTPDTVEEVKLEFNQILEELAKTSCTSIEVNFKVQGDAFSISSEDPIITAFQNAHQAVAGNTLSFGNKPFVDDGNAFSAVAGIPALTHGPAATGAHTLQECVSVAELVRVAQVYALTAVGYCISKRDDLNAS